MCKMDDQNAPALNQYVYNFGTTMCLDLQQATDKTVVLQVLLLQAYKLVYMCDGCG